MADLQYLVFVGGGIAALAVLANAFGTALSSLRDHAPSGRAGSRFNRFRMENFNG